MTFRTVLRDSTRPEHDQLDDMIGALNISDRDAFACFVNLHIICFQTMSEAAEKGSYSHELLCQMVHSLALDLDELGAKQLAYVVPLPKISDPLAIDYLVAGSRLGTKVLKKRWSNSNDLIVCRANKYFSLDSDPSFWPSTCQALANVAPESARAKAIVQDTKSLFQLFLTVYKGAMNNNAMVP
ncbi:hypothetical protein N9L47_02135 [Rhodobacteraceae bacterium]|nr:hypothetical protein [Paracoccaceae bacterium]